MSRRSMPDSTLQRRAYNPYIPFTHQLQSQAIAHTKPTLTTIQTPTATPATATVTHGFTMQKRRAATAAGAKKEFPMYLQDALTDPSAPTGHGLKPRPSSGPVMQPTINAINATPNSRTRVPLGISQTPQLAWNNAAADPTVSVTKAPKKIVSTRQRPSMLGTSSIRKPRVSQSPLTTHGLAPSTTTARVGIKPRVRPSLSSQLQTLTVQSDKLLDSVQRVDVHSNSHEHASPPYSILSPCSAAVPASASVSRRPPTFFDPFEFIYSNQAPDHILSLPAKRFVVGKLSCKVPGTVHLKTDRLCYMFAHPYQTETQIMLELSYFDMCDLRCTPSSSGGAFSFKVPHHLPAFDSGCGDYEPHLRNHRLTIEFHSQADFQKFKSQVYPSIQHRAIASKFR